MKSMFAIALLATAAAAAQPDYPPARYTMTVNVKSGEHMLETSGTIVVPPFQNEETYVEFQLSKLFELTVEVPGVEGTFSRADTDGAETYWRFTPAKPFQPGQTITANFKSSGGKSIATVFYIGPEASFASGMNTVWYPHVLVGGKNRRLVGEITYQVPDGFVVNSTGVRQGATNRFRIDRPSFFGFTAAKYVVTRLPGAIPVELYTLSDANDGKEISAKLKAIIDVLTREFGPFPYEDLKIAETPSNKSSQAGFSGTAGNGMMLVATDVLEDEFSTAFFAHELGHLWWGDIVNAGYFSESMAQLGSLVAVEEIEGAAAAEEYRRTGYPGYAITQSAAGYFMLTAAGFDQPLAELKPGTIAHELADSKGFLVMNMLRRLAGAETFRNAMRDLLATKQFTNVTPRDLFAAVQTATKKDIEWFYDDWFKRTGAPSWTVRWNRTAAGVSGVVAQTVRAYRAVVPIEVRGDNCHATYDLDLVRQETPFTFTTKCRVRSVEVDPHYTVLHWTDGMREDAEALVPYWKATALRWSGDRAAARTAFDKVLADLPQPDLHGIEFFAHYGLARLSVLSDDEAAALEHFRAAVAAPVRSEKLLPLMYLEIARIAARRNEKNEAVSAARSALSAEAASGRRSGTAKAARRIIARFH